MAGLSSAQAGHQPAPRLAEFSLTGASLGMPTRLHSHSVMVNLSHLIEEHAAIAGGCTLIATFQRLSLYAREIPRYQDVAIRCEATVVVGVPDVRVPPLHRVQVVPIEASWPLAQEWVVIASGPSFCVGLLARDAEGLRLDRPSRDFHGRLTTDWGEIDRLVEGFFAAIGRPPPVAERDPYATLASTRALQLALRQRLRT